MCITCTSFCDQPGWSHKVLLLTTSARRPHGSSMRLTRLLHPLLLLTNSQPLALHSHASCTSRTPRAQALARLLHVLAPLACLLPASYTPLERLSHAQNTPQHCWVSLGPHCADPIVPEVQVRHFVPLRPAHPRKDQRMWWAEGDGV